MRIDVLKRFGYYSTESNGHLSEYVPWYRKRLDEIGRWIDLSSWINGETGGYLRVCTEGRNWFETDFPELAGAGAAEVHAEKRSDEHGSYIIEALETGRSTRGHFNVPNTGLITNLPDGCMIESLGFVDRNRHQHAGTRRLAASPAPPPAPPGSMCSEWAWRRRCMATSTLLKQAMLHDPLVGAVCDPEDVWQMTDEMLVAQAQWLPQYASEFPKAAARLAAAESNGTRVKTMEGFQGMARLHTKTVEGDGRSRKRKPAGTPRPPTKAR